MMVIPWVVVLLVGLVCAIRVADLSVHVLLLVDHVVADTLSIGVLQISVEIDLDDTIRDGVLELLLGATAATVKDKEDWLAVLRAGLVLCVLLVLAEKLGVKLDIARLVDTVDVAESGSDGEVWGDRRQGLVDLVDIFWLGVEGVVVYIFVIDSVLLTTGDADFLVSS